MRILLVTQYFQPEDFRVNHVAAELVRRGHRVTVLTGTPNYPGGRVFSGYGWFRRTRESIGGIEVIRVPVIPRGRGGRVALAANYLSYALAASLVGPLRCRGPFDVILLYQMSPATMGIPAAVMKAVHRAPIVHWVQDLWPESIAAIGAIRANWPIRLIDRMVRWLYRAADLVLIQSRAFRPHVESRGVPPGRVRYLPNTAESSYVPVTADAVHPDVAALPAGFRVMAAGNMGVAQDLPTILAAAERTRDVADLHWLLAGDGTLRSWVEAEIARRGLGATVHLLKRYPVEAMPAIFAGVDVMLVALRPDPFLSLTIPSRLQSYLASGKPVIGALSGEGAAVIDEAGAGPTIEAGNPEALADAALSLQRLPLDARLKMGQNARAYFLAHFGTDMQMNRLEGFLSEVARTGEITHDRHP